MSTGVDKLIEANQKSAEQFRVAYGKEMYNQAIDDAKKMVEHHIGAWERHWGDNQVPDKVKSILAELKSVKCSIASFKKPIPQTENKQ